MIVDPLVFEQSVVRSFREPVRERDKRLLPAGTSLQRATTLVALINRAASEADSLCDAEAAAVYLEGTGAAFSGEMDEARGAARAGLLRQLVAAPATAPYLSFDHGQTLVARFASPTSREVTS